MSDDNLGCAGLYCPILSYFPTNFNGHILEAVWLKRLSGAEWRAMVTVATARADAGVRLLPYLRLAITTYGFLAHCFPKRDRTSGIASKIS